MEQGLPVPWKTRPEKFPKIERRTWIAAGGYVPPRKVPELVREVVGGEDWRRDLEELKRRREVEGGTVWKESSLKTAPVKGRALKTGLLREEPPLGKERRQEYNSLSKLTDLRKARSLERERALDTDKGSTRGRLGKQTSFGLQTSLDQAQSRANQGTRRDVQLDPTTPLEQQRSLDQERSLDNKGTWRDVPLGPTMPFEKQRSLDQERSLDSSDKTLKGTESKKDRPLQIAYDEISSRFFAGFPVRFPSLGNDESSKIVSDISKRETPSIPVDNSKPLAEHRSPLHEGSSSPDKHGQIDWDSSRYPSTPSILWGSLLSGGGKWPQTSSTDSKDESSTRALIPMREAMAECETLLPTTLQKTGLSGVISSPTHRLRFDLQRFGRNHSLQKLRQRLSPALNSLEDRYRYTDFNNRERFSKFRSRLMNDLFSPVSPWLFYNLAVRGFGNAEVLFLERVPTGEMYDQFGGLKTDYVRSRISEGTYTRPSRTNR
jgi:hypothetical protein